MTVYASVVVIGGGMAAARLVNSLRELDCDRSIAVVSDEPEFGYNRVLLPAYVSDDHTKSEMLFDVTTGHQVTIFSENPAIEIDTDSCAVVTAADALTYDDLVLATGSTVPKPECLAQPFRNALTLRSLADAEAIRGLIGEISNAVVVGGGLLGLETASAIAKQGIDVRVIHRNACLLNRQLNAGASDVLVKQLEASGLSFSLERQIVNLINRGDLITHVELDDGNMLETDLVILATGTSPNTELAEAAGITCGRGVVVNDRLQTNVEHVYAIGECAEFQGQSCGLVAPVYEQADVLADVLTGGGRRYQPGEASVRLKVDGVALYSAGDVNRGEHESLITSDTSALYRRLTFQDDQLLSAIFLGDTRGSADIQRHLNQPIVNNTQREQLLFGTFGD